MGYRWVFLGEASFETKADRESWLASTPDAARHDGWPERWRLSETVLPETVSILLRALGRGFPQAIRIDDTQVSVRAYVPKDTDGWLTYRGNVAAAWRDLPLLGASGSLDVFGAPEGPDSGFRITAGIDGSMVEELDEEAVTSLRTEVFGVPSLRVESVAKRSEVLSCATPEQLEAHRLASALDAATAREIALELAGHAAPSFRETTIRLVTKLLQSGHWDDVLAWIARPMWHMMPASHIQGLKHRPGIRALLRETSFEDEDLGYQALAVWFEDDPIGLYRRCERILDDVDSRTRSALLAQLANHPDAALIEPRWAAWCRRIAAQPVGSPMSHAGQQAAFAKRVLDHVKR